MPPRFSIILPTHNRADVLAYAIQSVLWQTEQSFELQIVGDGCTDNTAEVVASFGDPRIQWFDLPKGPHFGYANRNVALKQSTGEFIAYAQDDDIWFPDHLALLAETLDDQAVEWAYSRPLGVAADGTVTVIPTNLCNARDLQVFLTKSNSIPSVCVAHRRTCLEKYGFWPEEVAAAGDWVLWIRIIEGGHRANFAHCRQPTCLHFVADWRKAQELTHYAARDQLHAKGWAPILMQVEIPPGLTEQQVFFELLSSQGSNWVARLRELARNAVDRMAWAAIVEILPELWAQQGDTNRLIQEKKALERALSRSEKALSKAQKRSQSLSKELATFHASSSWRITAPLRLIKRMLMRLSGA